ncbi:hypothetical protein LTR62_008841 [Meristemomyces frigidus]|uniref:Uncharacterized protein n=1 Tax=Meristemomyces frigidus TaxID=1508187 RepID=A0AAN7TD54_9PEZI|nr:hypothetical protein LTR62_008841 [Meristemomyces frigidus]
MEDIYRSDLDESALKTRPASIERCVVLRRSKHKPQDKCYKYCAKPSDVVKVAMSSTPITPASASASASVAPAQSSDNSNSNQSVDATAHAVAENPPPSPSPDVNPAEVSVAIDRGVEYRIDQSRRRTRVETPIPAPLIGDGSGDYITRVVGHDLVHGPDIDRPPLQSRLDSRPAADRPPFQSGLVNGPDTDRPRFGRRNAMVPHLAAAEEGERARQMEMRRQENFSRPQPQERRSRMRRRQYRTIYEEEEQGEEMEDRANRLERAGYEEVELTERGVEQLRENFGLTPLLNDTILTRRATFTAWAEVPAARSQAVQEEWRDLHVGNHGNTSPTLGLWREDEDLRLLSDTMRAREVREVHLRE